MIFLLIGYMWLFIHRPFEVWDFLGAIRLERVYMICICIFWMLFHRKNFLFNRASYIVILLLFCVLTAEFLNPFSYQMDMATEEFLKVFLFTFLIMTSLRTEKELKMLLTGYCVIFFIYMLHSYMEFRNGRHIYRMGIVRMIGVDESMNDPNTFGASIIYSFPLLIPLWYLKGKRIWVALGAKGFVLIFFCLSLLCLILTGSRSCFVALITIFLILICLSKYRFQWFVLLALASPFGWFAIPTELKNRYMTIIDPSLGPKSAQESAEGRLHGLITGINIWKKHPVIGVGPGKSILFNPQRAQTHSFIGQVLSELGTIGMAIYLLIMLFVVMNYLRSCRYHKTYVVLRPPGDQYLHAVSVAVMITIFELQLLGIAGHNAYRYTWIWYPIFQGFAVTFYLQKIRKMSDLNCRAVTKEELRRRYGFFYRFIDYESDFDEQERLTDAHDRTSPNPDSRLQPSGRNQDLCPFADPIPQ